MALSEIFIGASRRSSTMRLQIKNDHTLPALKPFVIQTRSVRYERFEYELISLSLTSYEVWA